VTLSSIAKKPKKNKHHASLFTVAASAIHIECFSSDDEDGIQSDVSLSFI
jgi:hypothetical protein